MKHVKIIVVTSDAKDVRAWGEAKAVEVAGMPTIAHAESTLGHADTFAAAPGRHSYHFRVSRPCHLTLSTEIDGLAIGPPVEFDATVITAGRRYNFEVPS